MLPGILGSLGLGAGMSVQFGHCRPGGSATELHLHLALFQLLDLRIASRGMLLHLPPPLTV